MLLGVVAFLVPSSRRLLPVALVPWDLLVVLESFAFATSCLSSYKNKFEIVHRLAYE